MESCSSGYAYTSDYELSNFRGNGPMWFQNEHVHDHCTISEVSEAQPPGSMSSADVIRISSDQPSLAIAHCDSYVTFLPAVQLFI